MEELEAVEGERGLGEGVGTLDRDPLRREHGAYLG